MADAIPVRAEDLDTLLICACRYGLGRRTYITGVLSDLIRAYGRHLSPNDRATLIRDIEEQFGYEERTGHRMDQCDREAWEKALEYLRSLG